MKTLRLFILALVLAIPARAQVHLLVTTNGLIIAPPDFFGQNISDLTNALNAAGYAPGGGGGTGNASTNASQAWASGYTNTANGRWVFNGDVLAGSTNLVQKLASIELSLLGYQPASANLTNLAALNGAGITNLNATTAFSSGTVPIARLASGTPDGTKFIRDDGTLAVPSSSGVSLAGTNAWTGPNSFSADTTVSNLTVTGTHSVNTLEADSLVLANPIGVTALATNVAAARALLEVQEFSALLHKIATNSWANGDMPLHDGSTFGSVASTAAGRALLSAASASVQWGTYLLPVASTNGSYNATSWDGITDRLVTLDQFRDAINSLPGGSNAITSVTAPLTLTNGVLSIDTSGLGVSGSGGYTYLLTNSLGAWQGRDTSTNWTVISTTISSNDVPSGTGRFIEGGWSLVASNNSGTTATLFIDVAVGGTIAFRDSYSFSSGAGVTQRPMAAEFKLIRESSTTASLVQIGQNVNSASTPIGHGDFGSTANAATIVVTNIPVTWTSNVALSIAISCDTSVATNTALGLRVVNAWLRKEAATSTGSGVAADGTAVTNIVSSASITNTVAGGQTTLSVRPSGVSAGTYSNLVATIGADGRITDASSGSSSAQNPLDFYSEAEFMPGSEANVAYYGFPLLSGGVINSGAIALGSSASIYVAGLNGIVRVRNTTSADAGAQYVSDTAAVVITGGEACGAVWYSQSTNLGMRLRVGFIDSKTTTAPVDGIYGEQIDNAFRFVAVANSVTNAGSTTFYLSSNTICRVTLALTGTNSVLATLATNGVAAFSETITGGLPAGVDRSTGVGIVAYHTNNVAQNLCYIDKVWFGKSSSAR